MNSAPYLATRRCESLKEIIVDANFRQVRIALMEDHELVEIYIEGEQDRSIVGNIYKGRVENVLPGMQAAFVDIGTERNGFLYIKDVLNSFLDDKDVLIGAEKHKDCNIRDLLKVNQEILVQVVKDPIDNKGAKITTNITLPGRCIVLMPMENFVGISKRITNTVERERLKALAAQVKPENMGIIIRTAGEGCELSDVESDIEFLIGLWNRLLKESKKAKAPKLIHKDMTLFYRIMRDIFTDDIHRMVINNITYYNKAIETAKLAFPCLRKKIKYFNKPYGIFEHYGIEEKIEELISKKVWLRCGGYLIIEQTEALTVIDVNTGKYVGSKDLLDTVFKTNLEAAKEIPKQLRLRDIGGIIIIDFIDMNDEKHQDIIIEVMKNALKKDKSKSCIWGMTNLGLLEMTRKKVVAPKEDMMLSPCPYCSGTGKILSFQVVAKMIEGEIRKFLYDKDVKKIEVQVNSDIKDVMEKQYGKFLSSIGKKQKKKVFITKNDSLHEDEYRILTRD